MNANPALPSRPAQALAELMPMVRGLASRYSRMAQHEFEDLVQVGNIAVWDAIRRFDPRKGSSLRAYARVTVAGAMLHYMRDSLPLVRPPRELTERRFQVNQAIAALSQLHGRYPEPQEVADTTGLSIELVCEVNQLDAVLSPLSLDKPGWPDRGEPHADLADERTQRRSSALEERMMLASAVAQLDDSSRLVIELFYFQDRPQQEIADLLGISQTQVSRRLHAAVRRLLWLLTA